MFPERVDLQGRYVPRSVLIYKTARNGLIFKIALFPEGADLQVLHVPLKRRYQPTGKHGVISQNTVFMLQFQDESCQGTPILKEGPGVRIIKSRRMRWAGHIARRGPKEKCI
jgi:hypothetical protein